ncbi:hypothetical protein PLICRDRAFT_117403 [Plicaturopsis crispa FD-325 SS-3]|uniref:Unplaced genomic scaffold PLICRscaffold_16, whole genome shotgun sequence n=1 Tax=Plicaturopsis crispa FD-325 SS-3 TaxID=944288 RepID=A0A0C9T9J0_PLICR|nr:hypothetical protein PLICRDRAFT_117403 [Plicaturopsis crispa FD-325 SS-3]
MGGFTHVRVGHAGALNHKKRAANSDCATGGFYKTPTNGQTLDSSNPVNITWDNTCLTTDSVDIYLYAPGQAQSRIHMWSGVPFAAGAYSTTFEPKWWNDSSTMTLQLSIVESGTQPFLSPLPAGPVVTATYSSSGSTSASADTSTKDSGITNVKAILAKHGITGGKLAAAVIVPLLVIGLVVAAYIKMSRAKGAEKRKRWSEAVDKRMSTISTDWKAISGAGANAAIRHSMAGGNRASTFSFSGPRPSSTVAVEGGQAGIGARGLYTHENAALDSEPQMSQLRPGLRTPTNNGERVSRVSFAPDVRDSRHTVTSRAFHTGFVPPLPGRQSTGEMSPTQAEGPTPLTVDAINARLSVHERYSVHGPQASMDDFMPALSMMRTGGEDHQANNEYLFDYSEEMPLPPTPAHPATQSPVVGMMPMQPASVMSPDEMLRAYAARNAAGSAGPASPPLAYPAPAVSYNGNGMRTLYSPTTPATPGSSAPMMPVAQPYRHSMNEDDYMDAYGGTH